MYLELFVLLLTIILYWDYSYRRKKIDLSRRIQGPPVYPIIGNTFYFKQRTINDSVQFMVQFIQQYGKIARIWVVTKLIFVTIDPKVLEAILTSTKYMQKNTIYTFLKAWLGNGLLLSHGKKWFQRRKIITPTFHFKILEQFAEIFDEQSGILIERLRVNIGKGSFDIAPFITLFALDVISETALGTKVHAQTDPDCKYARAVHEITNIIMDRVIRPHLGIDLTFKLLAPRMKSRQDKALKILHEFTGNIINERRKILAKNQLLTENPMATDEFGRKRRAAFLDVLLQSTVDGKPLSNADIREEVDTFTFEGHDTTTAGITFTLWCLSRHPEVQCKAFNEIRNVIGDDKSRPTELKDLNDLKYLELVIKETMRLYPPVPFIGRKLDEDLHMDDYTLPKGSDLTIPLFYMFIDPEIFKDPKRFDPERFLNAETFEKSNPFSYIPFSAGPRNCIGQKFAMLEMKSSISKILRHYELLPLGQEPNLVMSVVTRSTNGVNLGVRPRLYL